MCPAGNILKCKILSKVQISELADSKQLLSAESGAPFLQEAEIAPSSSAFHSARRISDAERQRSPHQGDIWQLWRSCERGASYR
jgi:hypothetical protein